MKLTQKDVDEATARLKALYEPIIMMGWHAEQQTDCVETLHVLNELRLVVSLLESTKVEEGGAS